MGIMCHILTCPLSLSPAIECPVRWSHLVLVILLPLECFGPRWSSRSGQSEGVVAGGSVLGTGLLPLTLPTSCHSRVLGSVGGPTPLVSWDRPNVGGDEVPGNPAPLLTRLAQVSFAPDL